MTPSVGRVVHYVSYGSAGGEYTSQCRAAVVAAVPTGALPPIPEDGPAREWVAGTVVLDLCVLNPSGVFFDRCPQDEQGKTGGSWHWPERVEP